MPVRSVKSLKMVTFSRIQRALARIRATFQGTNSATSLPCKELKDKLQHDLFRRWSVQNRFQHKQCAGEDTRKEKFRHASGRCEKLREDFVCKLGLYYIIMARYCPDEYYVYLTTTTH